MTRTPWVVRGGTDPRAERRALAERAEGLASAALAGVRRPGRSGLLVYAAPALDLLLGPSTTEPDVELLPDPELALAVERADLTGFSWGSAEAESVRGALTALRGAAGEHRVVQALAEGTLPVPEGTATAELVAHHVPGVDLVFTDASGSVVTTANVKVAATEAVVLRHLGAHPEVPLVYASSDAAVAAGARGIRVVGPGDALGEVVEPTVVDIGVSSDEVDAQIGRILAGEATVPDVGLFDAFPWFSALAVTVRAVRRLRAGASTAEAIAAAGADTVRAGSGYVTGTLATAAAGSPLAGVPASLVGVWAADAALSVRRSWTEAARRDRAVAELAESLADQWAREPGP